MQLAHCDDLTLMGMHEIEYRDNIIIIITSVYYRNLNTTPVIQISRVHPLCMNQYTQIEMYTCTTLIRTQNKLNVGGMAVNWINDKLYYHDCA